MLAPTVQYCMSTKPTRPAHSTFTVMATSSYNQQNRIMDEVIDECAKALGLCTLKAYQREAVTTFLSGQDVFVALPTGYGKSIYGILPLVYYDKLSGMFAATE